MSCASSDVSASPTLFANSNLPSALSNTELEIQQKPAKPQPCARRRFCYAVSRIDPNMACGNVYSFRVLQRRDLPVLFDHKRRLPDCPTDSSIYDRSAYFSLLNGDLISAKFFRASLLNFAEITDMFHPLIDQQGIFHIDSLYGAQTHLRIGHILHHIRHSFREKGLDALQGLFGQIIKGHNDFNCFL